MEIMGAALESAGAALESAGTQGTGAPQGNRAGSYKLAPP